MSSLRALDDAITALTALRARAADGGIDDEQLSGFVTSCLHDGLFAHALMQPAAEDAAVDSAGGATPDSTPTPDTAATPGPAATPAGDATPPADGTEAAEGEGDGEEEPPNPFAEAEQLITRLGALAKALPDMGLSMPAKAQAFLDNAARVLPRLPQDDTRGDMIAKLLFEGVRVLDVVLQAAVYSAHRAAAAQLIGALRVDMAAVLSAQFDLTFTPSAGLERVDGEPPAGVSAAPRIAVEPAGTVLCVTSRAFVWAGQEGGKAGVLVAGGEVSEYRKRLIGVWRALEADGGSDAREDLDKLARWIDDHADGDPVAEASLTRHVLNLVHDRNRRGGLNGVEKWLLSHLLTHGIKQLPVRVGKAFDDSYSPSKYERQLEHSDQPAGTITRVVRFGLTDPGGLPLQKAVVGVAKG